jgi:hypothetical protein
MRKRKDGYRNGRVTNKAVDIWAGFGKKKSGWKVCSVYWLKRDDGWVFGFQPKVYRAGEWMVDRLDFEKLTLIDLSLSPSVGVFKSKSPVSESIKAPIMCVDA